MTTTVTYTETKNHTVFWHSPQRAAAFAKALRDRPSITDVHVTDTTLDYIVERMDERVREPKL